MYRESYERPSRETRHKMIYLCWNAAIHTNLANQQIYFWNRLLITDVDVGLSFESYIQNDLTDANILILKGDISMSLADGSSTNLTEGDSIQVTMMSLLRPTCCKHVQIISCWSVF